MRKIKFSENWNGKLFLDCFTTIRLYAYGKYPDFDKYEIEWNNVVLGIVEVACKKHFTFGQINTATALIDTGHETPYLKTLLTKFYGPLPDETALEMIVFKWVERYPEPTTKLLQTWQKKHFPKSDQPTLQFS